MTYFYQNLFVSSRVPSIELDEAASSIAIPQGYFESESAFSSFDAYKNFPHHCVPIIFCLCEIPTEKLNAVLRYLVETSMKT